MHITYVVITILVGARERLRRWSPGGVQPIDMLRSLSAGHTTMVVAWCRT
ncbi:MAG: hypothetical protein JO037_12380 [Actinobacteria bacterium]|nr:hypothetical protein [Actinomycetota bacterium]